MALREKQLDPNVPDDTPIDEADRLELARIATGMRALADLCDATKTIGDARKLEQAADDFEPQAPGAPSDADGARP